MSGRRWLALSFALNVALGCILVLSIVRHGSVEDPEAALEPSANRDENAGGRGRSVGFISSPDVAARPKGSWPDTLRAAGVPEDLIAKVAVADFENRWWARHRELLRKFNQGDIDEDALMSFMDRREIEQENEMRAALGEEAFRSWHRDTLLAEFDLAVLKLSDAETDSLYVVRNNWDQEKRRLEELRGKGELDERSFEEQIGLAQGQYTHELETLLGRERYAGTLNTDDGSGHLRRMLRAANASEAQIQELIAAQQLWNGDRAVLNREFREGQLADGDYDARIAAFNQARETELRRVLGDDGFAAYERASDNRYKLMKRFAPAWRLEQNDVDNLYQAIRYYESSIQDYRQRIAIVEGQGQEVDWPAVDSALQEYSRQTEQALREYLGEDRFARMKRHDLFTTHE